MGKLLKGTAKFEIHRNDMYWDCMILDSGFDENNNYHSEFFHCKWTGYNDNYWWTEVSEKNRTIEVIGDKGTMKKFVLNYGTNEVTEYGLELPEEDYERVDQDGQVFTYCTMRQVAKHTIGLDHKKAYIRHGKKFYKPYRNYFTGNSQHCEKMVEFGYMESDGKEKHPTYWFTRAGLDWLGDELGMKIYDERN